MKKSLRQILELLPVLVEDVKTSEEKLDNQQYSRRVYVRTLFAMIEGVTYAMKLALFIIARNFSKPSDITVPELVILKGSIFDLNDKGEVREREKHFRIHNNLKFTVKLVNRVLGSSIDLGVDTQDWTNFVSTAKIRNNVTHPKNLDDIVISDEDLKCIRSVNSWFNDIVGAMMTALKNFDWSKNVVSNRIPPDQAIR